MAAVWFPWWKKVEQVVIDWDYSQNGDFFLNGNGVSYWNVRRCYDSQYMRFGVSAANEWD